MATLEVQPHPRGPWLVSRGRRRLAVPPALGRRLLDLHGSRPRDEVVAGRLSGAGPGDGADAHLAPDEAALLARWLAPRQARDRDSRQGGGAWIRGRVPLAPARAVRRCAAALAPLTGAAGLAGAVATGVVGVVVARHAGVVSAAVHESPAAVAAALLLFLATAFWHELGHAAALRREGYPPGGIGGGLLAVIPVLYADVTATALLPRRGKLRVDAAGPAFQMAAAGVLSALAPAAPDPWSGALQTAARAALAAVAWSLLPFVRSDGYWMLCDALGVADLERRPPPAAGASSRRAVRAYRIANAAFLVTVAVALPWRAARLIGGGGLWVHVVSRPGLHAAALVLGAAAVAFVWWHAARRAARLLRPPDRPAQTAGARPDPAGL